MRSFATAAGAGRSSSSTTARPMPMAICISAMRSTISSRTWWCRTQSLLGKDAPYVPGWDCHGLPIEWKVEEQYRKKKLNKDEVPHCKSFAPNAAPMRKALGRMCSASRLRRLGVTRATGTSRI